MRIASPFHRWIVLAALLFALPACGSSTSNDKADTETSIPKNEHGLKIVEDEEVYLQTVAEDPSKELVDLEQEIPGVSLDIRYATTDNFMRERLYPVAKAYLRAPAAAALADAQQEFKERGLELKVFDGYRPYEVTEKIWEPYQNPDFVADPAEGSRHNRGCAVDLTLVDENGEELRMPTGYDDFTEKAGHSYQDLLKEEIRNRDLLRAVMQSHGFEALPTEWWHYDYVGWERFELLDLPLDGIPQAK
jgi:D-alanyl-D-alanine dipeptidase